MSATSDSKPTSTDALPFVAPCRTLSAKAPLTWLQRGWSDMVRAPLQSLFYGILLTLLSLSIAAMTWQLGLIALYLGLASGFVFIGPFLAMGLYSISYQLEIGRRPTLSYSLLEGRAHLRDTLVLTAVSISKARRGRWSTSSG